MPARRPRLLIGIATTVAASFLATTAPAAAVTVPEWPDEGRLPVDCFAVQLEGTPSDWRFAYVDNKNPVVSRIGFTSGRYTVVGPEGRSVALEAAVSQSCSGVVSMTAYLSYNGGLLGTTVPFLPTTSDAFSAVFRTAPINIQPDSAGTFLIPAVTTGRRYATFVLDRDLRLGSYTLPGPPDEVQGPWANQLSYVLRKTTLTSAVSKASVRKGKQVTVSGVLKYATDAGYVVDNGESVLVQTKVGRGSWKTRTTLTANGAGAVRWTFTPTKRTLVRLTHPQILTGRFTAGVTSTTRTIRVF